jgi:hypothetical protein
MVYVLVLACLWSAVGALVFFVRAKITLPQRLALTIGTSLVFGAVGWFDVSSIFRDARSNPPVVAKGLVKPDLRSSTATNSARITSSAGLRTPPGLSITVLESQQVDVNNPR